MAAHSPKIVWDSESEQMKLICRCGWNADLYDVVDPLEALIKSQVHQGEQRGLT